jgi:hypothetical protein
VRIGRGGRNGERVARIPDHRFRIPAGELEVALRTNRPFTVDYHPTKIPILYSPDYWLSAKEKTQGDFIDAFISDPSLCRLYLGLSKLDPETAKELREAMPASKLKIYAHVLDFFGAMFQIRDGKPWCRAERARKRCGRSSPRSVRIRARRFSRS